MSTNKHIDLICVVAIVVALALVVLFVNGAALGIQPQTKTMGYENKLFDNTTVHTIDIIIDDWDSFLKTAQSEEYTVCDVVIDGEVFADAGIRGKGNTSLSNVASMDSERYSFKIEFDQYDSTKSYYGLDKLSLNNMIQDNTMMKDYLTYQMMNEFGVAAPLCSYVYITVNGEDWGLYLAVEAVEESFLQRNYGSDYGELYKPDSMDMGGGRGNGKDFDFEGMIEGQQGSAGFGGGMAMGSGSTKLQYIDDEISSYSVIFDSAKTDVTQSDQQRLIQALKTLSQSEDVSSAVAVEDVIRYFVVHNYVVNGDSYTGSMVHNYYLYENDGMLSMIPWDYNLAFGTFGGGDASGSVSDDIDAPLSVTGSDRPMIDWIFDSQQYSALYHTLFQEFLDTVEIQTIIAQAKELIGPYVEKDPTKFCTYEEFEKGVQTLASFCALRNQSITAQLAGQDGAVDASGITLSDMGTMGGGMGGVGGQRPDGFGGNTQRPVTPDGNMQIPAMPENGDGGNMQMPQMPDGQGGMQRPGQSGMVKPEDMPDGMPADIPNGMENFPFGESENLQQNFPNREQSGVATTLNGGQLALVIIIVMVLAAGLIVAFKFKRW